jgi:hypothetical protein
MWKAKVVLVIAATLFAVGSRRSRRRSTVAPRATWPSFQQCKGDCASARDVDDCLSKCRTFFQQYQASCN